MTETNPTDLGAKITELVAELEQCRKRALEIESQLSVIDGALQTARNTPKRVGRPRGRPRKEPIYAVPVNVEEFDGNTAG